MSKIYLLVSILRIVLFVRELLPVMLLDYNEGILGKAEVLFIAIIIMNQYPQSCRSLKPPLCPKVEKASTIRFAQQGGSHIGIANKNQRVRDNSPGASGEGGFSGIPSSNQWLQSCNTGGQEDKKERWRCQYQQYSRKNYFRNKKDRQRPTQADSHLTEKLLPPSPDEERRLKSKSALNYAKYFIKQVSVLPTEPSSNTPQAHTGDVVHCPEEERLQPQISAQKKSSSLFSHEQRQKSRKKISQRLKSIKNTRAASNRKTGACSIQKKVPLNGPPAAKIAASSASITVSESNLLRMKARARNQRVILKVKQFHNRGVQQDACLMVSSKIDRSFTERHQIADKIDLHLQILNLLPAYVKEFKEIYEESECWEELMFLVYKRFYLERIKVQRALAYDSTNLERVNPFRFSFCLISEVELDGFRDSLQSLRLQERLSEQNGNIGSALRNLYNHIIQKSGRHINLLEEEDFLEEMLGLMGQQVRLLRQNEIDQLQGVRERRVLFTAKCSLLLAFLSGQQLDLEGILAEASWTKRIASAYAKLMPL